MSEDAQQRRTAGETLRIWRKERKLTGIECAELLQAELGSLRRVSSAEVSRWETGTKEPGPPYLRALQAIGAPVAGWMDDVAAQPGTQSANAATHDRVETYAPAAPDPAAEVQAMLERGEPLADVYTRAATLLAGRVSRGLTTDQARAWESLARLLREGARERGRAPALEHHPDWPRTIDLVLDAVARLPGGTQAVLDAVRAAGGPGKVAA